MIPNLKYYKLARDVQSPTWGTFGSACFDLQAYLPENASVKMYSVDNVEYNIVSTNGLSIGVIPGERAMIPTGLILDIPDDYSVRIHIRSSMAGKKGITLANAEGVIDSDYVDPLFVLVHNTSKSVVYISNGDRIAQAELVPQLCYCLDETSTKPTLKGNRTGGFGSTGK
jgi:dUTP pyrophosphatase